MALSTASERPPFPKPINDTIGPNEGADDELQRAIVTPAVP
jgi:hypothetical protein